MTLEEKILEILIKVSFSDRGYLYLHEDYFDDVAKEITALKLDIPTEEEIEKRFPLEQGSPNIFRHQGIIWFKSEIERRNK